MVSYYMIVFTAIICFARHGIFSGQVYLLHDKYTFPRLVYCFMTGIVFHNMRTFSRRVYLFYNRYNCFHNMYMFSRRVYFFTTGIFSTSSILFHDRYISSRQEWNVIPPAENRLSDRFSNGNGRNSALVREPQTNKKKCHTHSVRRIFLEGSGHVVRSF